MSTFDIIILGSGPGGYVAAIRASQLGKNVAIVEKSSLGGICLNWGCIPTKALLKSAQVLKDIQLSSDYGIEVEKSKVNFKNIIQRSRHVAETMSKGVAFLMKKNKITVINGYGKIQPGKRVEVTDNEGKISEYKAENIIIATGGRSKTLSVLPLDGEVIFDYKKAMSLEKLPAKLVVVGAGAIGCEFAYFYQSLGVSVTLIEFFNRILPNEDEDTTHVLQQSLKKSGMKILTTSRVVSSKIVDSKAVLLVSTPDGEIEIESDAVLSAIGIVPNVENIGLEYAGITLENGKIKTDDYYKTNMEGYYAIGDVTKGPALAHVASAEGIVCVEKIAGLTPQPIDYNNIPACTYTQPEIASVGWTEAQAKEKGYELAVGKFPFTASGKAQAAGHTEGFVKVVFDKKYGELLGAQMVGHNVTELIAEMVVARHLETTAHEIIKSIHPHPTMSEAIMEATAAAIGEVIHL